MSHLNPFHPNILQDKLRGTIYTASEYIALDRKGIPCVIFVNKRQLVPSRNYRSCADAQIIGVDEEQS